MTWPSCRRKLSAKHGPVQTTCKQADYAVNVHNVTFFIDFTGSFEATTLTPHSPACLRTSRYAPTETDWNECSVTTLAAGHFWSHFHNWAKRYCLQHKNKKFGVNSTYLRRAANNAEEYFPRSAVCFFQLAAAECSGGGFRGVLLVPLQPSQTEFLQRCTKFGIWSTVYPRHKIEKVGGKCEPTKWEGMHPSH